MLYKSKILTLETMAYSWYVDEYISMGPRGRFHSYKCYIRLFGTCLYMGPEIDFLGLIIDSEAIELQTHILEKIKNFPEKLSD